jgi:hypothetical protein
MMQSHLMTIRSAVSTAADFESAVDWTDADASQSSGGTVRQLR